MEKETSGIRKRTKQRNTTEYIDPIRRLCRSSRIKVGGKEYQAITTSDKRLSHKTIGLGLGQKTKKKERE